MKAKKLLLNMSLLLSAGSVILAGCNYKVTSPMWDQPYSTPPAPTITSIEPSSEAVPGVNTITIRGHNLVVPTSDSLTPNTTIVTFNNVPVGLAYADSTTLVIYRPNVIGTDSIKVIPHNAIAEAVYGPYKIDSVIRNYGSFLQNLPLGAIALDSRDSLYVFETGSKTLYEALSPTENVAIGILPSGSSTPTGAFVGSDGNLYVTEGIRPMDRVNLATGEITQKWVTLPGGRAPTCGDCGPGSYLFVGGNNTDLIVFSINRSGSLQASQLLIAGGYASEQILAIKVYNGYVYVASRANSTTPAIIWKNQITADSIVGTRQEVLDMGATRFSSDLITGIAFSSTGTIYISTASPDPLLVFDPAAGKAETFYNGIVPANCLGMAYSKSSNYMYVITGDGTSTNQTTVYRLDMGTPGGANF